MVGESESRWAAAGVAAALRPNSTRPSAARSVRDTGPPPGRWRVPRGAAGLVCLDLSVRRALGNPFLTSCRLALPLPTPQKGPQMNADDADGSGWVNALPDH